MVLQELLSEKPPDAEEGPILWKQLVSAWDLAFAWLADEPFQHHPALPLSVLLALMATAPMWGWPLEASVLGLAWAGILRIGEVLMADGADLVLPEDTAPGTSFAILKIKYPKTRGRAARHQAARVDPPDVVALLAAVYGGFEKPQKLWPYSAATLRKRMSALLVSCAWTGYCKKGRLAALRPGLVAPGRRHIHVVPHRRQWTGQASWALGDNQGD